jgi:plasmid stability protein
MGDLLIRGIDPNVKKKLSDSAHDNGRSLSDEAAIRLQQSLARDSAPKQPAGQRLRSIINSFVLTDSERARIAESRHEADRAPPSFEPRG